MTRFCVIHTRTYSIRCSQGMLDRPTDVRDPDQKQTFAQIQISTPSVNRTRDRLRLGDVTIVG